MLPRTSNSAKAEELRRLMDMFQLDIGRWARHNFDDNNGLNDWAPLAGMVEELGELHHARLKARQRIREHRRVDQLDAKTEEELDALGDIIVYMMDYCHRRQISLGESFLTAWNQVKERDWKQFPKDGRSARQ